MTEETFRQKTFIRQRALKLRQGLTPQVQAEKSLQIEQKLFELQDIKQALLVMFYISFASEVQTLSMIRRALQAGYRVGVPVVDEERRQLLISEIYGLEHQLHKGSFGVWEPKPQFIHPLELPQIEVVILPGVAFDERGHRLGYGKGYYDKLLKEARHQVLIGLAYEVQIAPAVPESDQDVKVHLVVTENRVIHCQSE